jgi:hypothetical protein
VKWNAETVISAKAVDPGWQKWTSTDPIPPHWSDVQRFKRLIAAYIGHDENHGGNTMVREFVSTFRGLSGSAKLASILDTASARRLSLAKLYDEGRNQASVNDLLMAIKDEAEALP